MAGFILLLGGNAAALATLLKGGFRPAAGLVMVPACGGITTALMILGLGHPDAAVMGFPLVVLISGLHAPALGLCAGHVRFSLDASWMRMAAGLWVESEGPGRAAAFCFTVPEA